MITLNEIDIAFKEAGIEIVDTECEKIENHISPKIVKYLEEKWETKSKYEKENQELKKIGDELLKEISESDN